MEQKYRTTVIACYLSYITQAIVINLAPLFFTIFINSYDISIDMLSKLILLNFVIQICTDILSVYFTKILSLRSLTIIAHIFCVTGLVLLSVFPYLFSNRFSGLCVATVIYAIGGGMIEVFVNPIIDAIPATGKKSARLSLLHSFYCWGHMAVVLLTTLSLLIFGNKNWSIVVLIWALIPLVNIFLFSKVSMENKIESHEKTDFKKIFSAKFFVFAAILMLSGGASEQIVAQWGSLFAENALGVSKVWGDILGPMSFALFMGISRVLYAAFADRLHLKGIISVSSFLTIVSYLMIVIFKNPVISLAGFMLCGFSVGIFWPGVLSLSSRNMSHTSPAMFGTLSLFGDIGCSLGPWFAGFISGKSAYMDLSGIVFLDGLTHDQSSLKFGILASVIFPLSVFIFVRFFNTKKHKQKQ